MDIKIVSLYIFEHFNVKKNFVNVISYIVSKSCSLVRIFYMHLNALPMVTKHVSYKWMWISNETLLMIVMITDVRFHWSFQIFDRLNLARINSNSNQLDIPLYVLNFKWMKKQFRWILEFWKVFAQHVKLAAIPTMFMTLELKNNFVLRLCVIALQIQITVGFLLLKNH